MHESGLDLEYPPKIPLTPKELLASSSSFVRTLHEIKFLFDSHSFTESWLHTVHQSGQRTVAEDNISGVKIENFSS